MRETQGDDAPPDTKPRGHAKRRASRASQPPPEPSSTRRTGHTSAAPQPGTSGGEAEPAAKRGRPVGTVGLSEATWSVIVSYVRAGSFAWVAAQAVGISPRTFREWMARGEARHPTRPPTTKLVRFAADVRRAEAEARVAAEARVYQEKPALWLARAGRSRPEREGWTEPAPEPGQAAPGRIGELSYLSEPELHRHLQMVAGALIEQGVLEVPRCAEKGCACASHQPPGA